MIHLEEYLDTLEALPMELQRQFTLMRELDALSQDIQDQMKQSTEEFINNPPTKEDPKHAEYLRSFSQLFSTVLKHGEEKVALATQTYDLVDKHIRRLDDDLAKFEERQLAVPRIPHRWGLGGTNPNTMSSAAAALGGRQQTMELGDDAAADRGDQRRATSSSAAGARRGAGDKDDTPGAAGSSARKKRAHRDTSPPPQANGKASTPSSRRGRGGGGGGGGGGSAHSTTAAGAGASSTATHSVSSAAARGNSSGGAGPSAAIAGGGGGGGSVTDSAGSRTRGTATATKTIPQVFADMPIDPNEPRYCYCQQVSYGEMVACDDEDCKIEWFHLDCVDLKAPPKGQWFCDDCSLKHNKKHRDRHHHHA